MEGSVVSGREGGVDSVEPFFVGTMGPGVKPVMEDMEGNMAAADVAGIERLSSGIVRPGREV